MTLPTTFRAAAPAVLALAATLPLAAGADARAADEAAIRALKEVLWPKACFEQDTALLERILAPEFAEYQSTNVLIKRDGEWRAVASHVSGFRKKS